MRFLLTAIATTLLISKVMGAPTETFLFISEATPQSVRLKLGDALIQEIKGSAEEADRFHVVSTPRHRQIVSLAVPQGAKAARLKDLS